MTEQLIPRVEKEDIRPPELEAGGTAIVLQRHEKYNRDRNAEDAGSITAESAEDTKIRDRKFFDEVLEAEDGDETMVLFISSDTQYAGKGHRSMETAQLALDAASEAMQARGIDPSTRILNLSDDFSTRRFSAENRDIRPMKGIVEPKMFDDNPDFVKELGREFNPPELQADIDARRTDVQLSPAAFEAYEADDPKVQELREKHGAEGVYDILDRTKHSIAVMERYASWFHKANPDKKLIIWAASHYDTISPLVKDATDTSFDAYTPVDYGAGVVMTIEPGSHNVEMHAQGQEVTLRLGGSVVGSEVEKVNVTQ